MKVKGQLEDAQLHNKSSDPSNLPDGLMWLNTTSNKMKAQLQSAIREILTADQTQTLTNKTINAPDNTITNIRNAEIKADAAIARSKLASGTASHVVINDGSGVLSSEAQLSGARGGTGADLSAATAGPVITNGSGVMSSEAQLAIARGGTGAGSKAAAFDALSPMTTSGDIIYGGASGTGTRLAKGSDGQFLTLSGGVPSWAGVTVSTSVRSVNTTDTATTSDDVLVLSGASFTETLYTAAGNSGRMITLIHNGTSLSQVYTIDGNASETIGGSTTYGLYTNGETLKLISDGSNWLVLEHFAKTSWANAGTMTIASTGGALTKGSVQSVDKVYWARDGEDCHFRMYFRQTNATGSASVAGDYKFGVSSVGSIDTTKVEAYTTVEDWNSFYNNDFSVGTSTAHDNTNDFLGTVVVYDSSYVRMFGQIAPATAGCISHGGFPITSTNVMYALDFVVPMSGWKP